MSGSNRFSLRTLIIIIFVVASLALLIWGVAIPYQRQRARQAKCLSNLKQLVMALEMYNMDGTGEYPWDSSEPDKYYRFLGKLYPFHVNDLSLFRCPSSSDRLIEVEPTRFGNSPFTEKECEGALSYAYGHEQGRPCSQPDAPSWSAQRLLADKYATHDYAADPYPEHRPRNHPEGPNLWGRMVRRNRKSGHRNFAKLDGSVGTDTGLGPLEADPDREFENSGDPEHDQTGPDWWSDPPDK